MSGNSPTMSPTEATPLEPPFGSWWISFVVLFGVCFIMVQGIKRVLKQAEEKRMRIQKNLKLLRKRIIAGDEFFKTHLYSWDWVMVFKVAEADEKPTNYQKKHSIKNVVSKLCEAGLQTSMFYSVQQVIGF
jgi:hypothetical protein